ncbi:hypothetical protein ACN28I_24030 [Archangium gephyra]|uniref:hypothetical protein n=1 Tax=Archangium gephyra TaxID=48 RepID=UPI003B7C5554
MALSTDIGTPHLRPARAPAPLEVEEVVSLRGLEQLQGEWRWLWTRCPTATTYQRPEWLLPWYRRLRRVLLAAAALGGDPAQRGPARGARPAGHP